jgi:hypothetical protein
LIPGVGYAQTIVTPAENDAWTCPGTFQFYATGCVSATYLVIVKYKNNMDNWSILHTQSCSPNGSGVIDVSLGITATPDCGRHDGLVILSKFVSTPSPHYEQVATQEIFVDGPTCP